MRNNVKAYKVLTRKHGRLYSACSNRAIRYDRTGLTYPKRDKIFVFEKENDAVRFFWDMHNGITKREVWEVRANGVTGRTLIDGHLAAGNDFRTGTQFASSVRLVKKIYPS
jgi:hypothetical protein